MLTASKLESLTPWLYPSPTKPPTELSSPSRKAWKQDEGEDTVMTGMNPLDKKKPKGQGQSRSSHARAAWASPEEMQKRRDDGSCLRCGKQGHRIMTCKLRPAKRPSTQVHSMKAEQDASESSGVETSDSEKE